MTGLNGNLQIAKTIKLFINGEFPRTESGRSFPIYYNASKKVYANVCRASRKDFRNAVSAALKAHETWTNRTAYNRSQILYRMAEMTEGKRHEFSDILNALFAYGDDNASLAIDVAIDSFVYYAGFADKYQQLIGAVNPVAGPHHNFTTAEAVGLVVLFPSESFDFGKLISQISAIIVSGNSSIVILPPEGAGILSALGEVFATSDLPKGVVNLLSGYRKELLSHVAGHMEVDAISFQDFNKNALSEIKTLAAENMKRVTSRLEEDNSLEHLLKFVEYKTVWHPIAF